MNKKLQFVLIILAIILNSMHVNSQCIPDNCLSLLPPYGGICDSSLVDGRVNEPYFDKISFHITSACIDLGTLDPQYSGIGAKMLKLHTFSFTGLPAGLTGATNQVEYNAPSNGCADITGTPTTIGTFKVTIHFLANIRTWPLSSTCGGIFPVTVDENNQPFEGDLDLLILPDPSFTGLVAVYCTNNPSVTLTPTGTQGGTFSGPGVSGNIFDPAIAGLGTHEIKYVVTAQEGLAIGPATDSSSFSVTVLTGFTATDTVDICQGDSILWRGQHYGNTGVFYDSLVTVSGCDSVFILNLTAHPSFESISNAHICQGDIYSWNGNTYSTGGIYYDSLFTVNGCDSIIILNLTVNQAYEFTENEEICQGDTFIWRGNNYTVTGIYYDSLLTSNNCDSVFILNLIVNGTYYYTTYDSLCSGQIYDWQGYQFSTAGTYYDSLFTVDGCDSIFTLHLFMWPAYAFFEDEYICQGDTFFWRGAGFNSSGTYYDSLLTVNGCDSVYVLNLMVHPHHEIIENAPICQGSYYTWRGNDYNVAGTYYDSLQTAFGCDSIFVLNLSVVASYPIIEKVDICDDDVYFWRGNTYNITGAYYDTVVGLGFCDTVYQLNLGVHNSYMDSIAEAICAGDVFSWRGYDYTIAGIYYDSLLSLYACDSIFKLELIVDTVDLSVTQNGAVLTSEAQNALYQWVDCDNGFDEIQGESIASFTAQLDGNYAVIVTQYNCTDTSACFNVIIGNIETNDFSQIFALYPNPNKGIFNIKTRENTNVNIFNVQGKLVYEGYFIKGTHVLDLSQLSESIYFIKADNSKNIKFEKMIIIK